MKAEKGEELKGVCFMGRDEGEERLEDYVCMCCELQGLCRRDVYAGFSHWTSQ